MKNILEALAKQEKREVLTTVKIKPKWKTNYDTMVKLNEEYIKVRDKLRHAEKKFWVTIEDEPEFLGKDMQIDLRKGIVEVLK